MAEELLTNPAADDDATQEDIGTAAEVQTAEDEPQLDEDGNPIEEQPDDEEEIDLDEETKLKLPKSQAEKLRLAMLRQADYTQKTQALAQSRQQFEAEREQARQMDAVEQMARGDLANVSAQISQYENFDWAGARANAQAIDSQNFDRAQMDTLDAHWQQYQLLKARQGNIHKLLAVKQSERQFRQQQQQQAEASAVAKLLDEGTPELKKAIPNWNRTEAAKLTDSMIKHFGIPREEFDGISDPRLYLVMNAAVKWANQEAKNKATKTIEKLQASEPAAKAAGGKNPVPPGKLDDRLSTEEWTRRRNAQVLAREKAKRGV